MKLCKNRAMLIIALWLGALFLLLDFYLLVINHRLSTQKERLEMIIQMTD